MDESSWFNAAWAIACWTALTAASAFGAVETHGLVRILLVAVAVLFAVLLVYTGLALTVGIRLFRRVVAMIEAGRQARRE